MCGEFEEFRPITTVNTVGKIFEYFVLSRLKMCVKFHELQFGFTTGGGCDKAEHVVCSVEEYFNEYGSTVYLSALDIFKVYDRLNHCAILLQMKRVKVPIDIILVFWYWFYHLFAVVAWCGVRSTPFDIKSGVRQGGVASCWIFNMVTDGLVSRLEASGLRCYFQGIFAGCVLYADDIMLMSGSIRKLQLMLNICFSFANEFGLIFNAK